MNQVKLNNMYTWLWFPITTVYTSEIRYYMKNDMLVIDFLAWHWSHPIMERGKNEILQFPVIWFSREKFGHWGSNFKFIELWNLILIISNPWISLKTLSFFVSLQNTSQTEISLGPPKRKLCSDTSPLLIHYVNIVINVPS